MSAQPDPAPVTPYAPEPGAPAELLAQLRADARAAQWVPAFEREWAAALDESRRTFPLAGPITVKRITGHANLWVSECVITYDGVPSYSVSSMEFADQHVVHETQTSPAPSARRPGGPRSQSRCQAEPSLEPRSRPRPGQPADQPVT
ncbi:MULTISPECIES: DUF6247 family protein [Streptomyces]|uniref:SnoaL-like domain-containing protein n=1 Tax=Streptomyces canarius TaxID=285453 RepID=A0ABQ3DAW5_9ACTN|nr:DUF6247 family protein [Streptomyces canarius]GHA69133.1 hypothetical protein GCM10010345_85910 [Streptomyces canarius]